MAPGLTAWARHDAHANFPLPDFGWAVGVDIAPSVSQLHDGVWVSSTAVGSEDCHMVQWGV
jgi:hypothetical protein